MFSFLGNVMVFRVWHAFFIGFLFYFFFGFEICSVEISFFQVPISFAVKMNGVMESHCGIEMRCRRNSESKRVISVEGNSHSSKF